MQNTSLINEKLEIDPPAQTRVPSRLQTRLLKVISNPISEQKQRENSSHLLNFLNPIQSPQYSKGLYGRHTPTELIKAPPELYGRPGAYTPSVLNSNAPIQFPAAKHHTSALIKLTQVPKGSIPDSLVLNRVSSLDGPNKLRGRLGNSRVEETRKISPEQQTKDRAEKRTIASVLSPRTVGAHYDYHSQHLTFIPEKLNASSLNKSSFLGFNELAKTTNSTHQSILGNLVMEDVSIKKTEALTGEKKFHTLQKVLDFNRLQKEAYDKEIKRQHKEVVLPLVLNEQEKQQKEKQMRHVKVLPSQSFYYQMNHYESMQQKSAIADMSFSYNSKEKTGKNDTSVSEISGTGTGTTPAPMAYKYKFFWYFKEEDQRQWMPEAREGHTLTTVGKQVVLYGGFSNNTKSDVAIYNPNKNQWRQIVSKGEAPINGRHGHSACEYNKDCVIIFGGEERLGLDLKFKEYLNDARAFYPEKGEWKYLVCSGKILSPRRNHAAAIYDKTMYVYGGVNYQGEYLAEVWTLNLKNNTWSQFPMSSANEHGIAYHTMCACFIEKNLGFIHKSKGAIKEFDEGFYVFGGKDEEGRCLSTLKYFDPHVKPLQWKYPATKGNPPAQRFNHTTLFYQPLALLVIYGGKNNFYEDPEKLMELNDIRILNLETMTWSPTASYGDVPQIPRTNHAATLYGHAMLIFGGINVKEYSSVYTRVVELNQINVQKLMDDQTRKQSSPEQPQQISPDASPTFTSSPTLYKGEKKKGTVSFLPPPSSSSDNHMGEDKTLKLKGTLKGAVAKVRIMESWKKMRTSLKNPKEVEFREK